MIINKKIDISMFSDMIIHNNDRCINTFEHNRSRTSKKSDYLVGQKGEIGTLIYLTQMLGMSYVSNQEIISLLNIKPRIFKDKCDGFLSHTNDISVEELADIVIRCIGKDSFSQGGNLSTNERNALHYKGICSVSTKSTRIGARHKDYAGNVSMEKICKNDDFIAYPYSGNTDIKHTITSYNDLLRYNNVSDTEFRNKQLAFMDDINFRCYVENDDVYVIGCVSSCSFVKHMQFKRLYSKKSANAIYLVLPFKYFN